MPPGISANGVLESHATIYIQPLTRPGVQLVHTKKRKEKKKEAPLGECRNKTGNGTYATDQHSAAHARRSHQVSPGFFRIFQLDTDCRLDLGKLGFGKFGFIVSFGVICN